jgi:hypothetical protein
MSEKIIVEMSSKEIDHQVGLGRRVYTRLRRLFTDGIDTPITFRLKFSIIADFKLCCRVSSVA